MLVSKMEGSKEYRAKIDRLVKQRAKFHLNDKVRVKGRGSGFIGTIDSIGSLTNIKDVNSTKVQYLVRIDANNLLYSFSNNELQLIIQPEKVIFS